MPKITPTFQLFNDDDSMNTPTPTQVERKLAEVTALEHTAINKLRLQQISSILAEASLGRLSYMYDDLEQIGLEGVLSCQK